MNIQDLPRVLRVFKRRLIFGKLFVNDDSTPVEIKYDGPAMTIRGLNDLPTYVKVTRKDRGEASVTASSDRVSHWTPIDGQAADELQI